MHIHAWGFSFSDVGKERKSKMDLMWIVSRLTNYARDWSPSQD